MRNGSGEYSTIYDRNMTRAALITIHSLPNFGSVFQAYATQVILENAGIRCEIIDYLYPNEWHYNNGTPKASRLKRIATMCAVPLMKFVGYNSQHVLQHNLEQFKKKHFNLTRPYINLERLNREDWGKYDVVIAGSDQIWSPKFLKGDKAFLLSFVPDNVRKISISSSFGCTELPPDMIEHYRKALSRFDAIGIREEGGLHILHESLNIRQKTSLMLDPTLLLSSAQWNSIADSAHRNDRYIVLYGLYYSFDARPYIFDVLEYFQKKLGYRIISLAGYHKAFSTKKLDVECRETATPQQFLSLFRDASLVVTTSFHGSAFAINYGKPLISIVPESGDDRQKSLLSILGAAGSITRIGTDPQYINPYYDAVSVKANLDKLRLDNIATIKKNIFNQ